MSKNWVFTINNYTDGDMERLNAIECEYVIYGKETGESGTPHLQGYIEMNDRQSRRQMSTLIPRAFLETRRGTQLQAVDYCKKQNDYVERGTPRPGAGRPKSTKNKLLPFLPDIKDKGLAEFAEHPEATFHLLKHAKEVMALTESPRCRNTKPLISWYWGPTGTGKTLRAFQEAESKGLTPYIKSGNGKWFDGYDGHEFVIFDDFRDSHIEFGFLLRLLDRYPMRVELKGSSRQWKATRIVVTSPTPPEECYKNMQLIDKYDKIQQLLRRIDEVKEIKMEDPQTPQGGLKRSASELTPYRFHYPVEGSPIHVRSFLKTPESMQFPSPTQTELVSPTQPWGTQE